MIGQQVKEFEDENKQSTMRQKDPDLDTEKTAQSDSVGDKFAPYDPSETPTIDSGLPSQDWIIVQSAPANFPPQHYLETSRNLVENPNLTASHLVRAELPYQSFADATFNSDAKIPEELASIVKHLRPECRPQLLQGGMDGYELSWTVVRKLIPRNPKLDNALMQTCHLFTSHQDIIVTTTNGEQTQVKAERYMVIYIPHATSPDEVPYYHPTVRSLAMLYTYLLDDGPTKLSMSSPGQLSLYYNFFPSHPLDNRLSRTALMLLQIIHKHSRGRQAGYKKRVHHDQIVPQKTFGDTYSYLKGKYAKPLIEGWVEQTPPEKHVFEDLGIAAFLIELWVEMYALQSAAENDDEVDPSERRKAAQAAFPGFVDIGCGNGLLVYILNAEGWSGWGFDARRRKTWETFPAACADKLKELLLLPGILRPDGDDSAALRDAPLSHDGVFPRGTFIISNHADELTPWTPLLAYLSGSPFIAIPCCSHDLGGTRFRAPIHKEYFTSDHPSTTLVKGKQPSAYASLCSWVCHLTEVVGYQAEKEHLRIPSTRNTAVVGRKKLGVVQKNEENLQVKMAIVRELVVKEVGEATTLEQVSKMWMRSGYDLVKKPAKGGH